MNKRPSGTKILQNEDRAALVSALEAKKQELELKQQKMSVARYTQRAKNQYMRFVEDVQGIEESLKVLQRKKFVMKE